MIILGINAYHADASAAIMRDGELLAAAEEERFSRVKHCAGFPELAIKYCLDEAGVNLEEVDHIVHAREPSSNLMAKIKGTFFSPLVFQHATWDRIRAIAASGNFDRDVRLSFPEAAGQIQAEFHNVEHHLAHAAGSYFASSFDEAALVTIDGYGDFASLLVGHAKGNELDINHRTFFPHSLGTYYLMVSQYLGFTRYGDEGKVMAFASMGDPDRYLDKMRKVAFPDKKEYFKLGLDYFQHHKQGTEMTWEEGTPEIGKAWSNAMVEEFGPARQPEEPYEQRHYDIAAALQKNLEEVLMNIFSRVHRDTGSKNLALGGGVALNSVSNGMIRPRTGFENIYILPAAGDGGLSVGAAYYTWHKLIGRTDRHPCKTAYLGPSFDENECRSALERNGLKWAMVQNTEAEAARHLQQGKIVGWFQGRMEFGPRALGNRSILVDPRRKEMKDVLNARIKHREEFRPFAPSILREKVGDYFEQDYPAPFMLMVYNIKREKRGEIPAVVHVDGTGRLQTVTKADNPRYYGLIKEFEKLTGVPIVLNTSFNDSEPIVCSPDDAIDCFKRTKMDVLFLGNIKVDQQ